VVQFSEGEAGKKTRGDWFKAFLEELPRTVEFKEVAKRRDESGASFSEADKAQVEAGRRIAARVNPPAK